MTEEYITIKEELIRSWRKWKGMIKNLIICTAIGYVAWMVGFSIWYKTLVIVIPGTGIFFALITGGVVLSLWEYAKKLKRKVKNSHR